MSFCRWSSDNFKSDLYIYESYDGYSVNVASRKIVEELPPLYEPDYYNINEEEVRKLSESMKAQDDAIDICTRVDIGLPYDGKSFSLDTAQECVDLVKHLIEIGYRVPDGVIEALEEEIDESE